MASRHGATGAEWDALASLALPDVRPCVVNPDTPTRDGKPNAGTLSKRPSRLYFNGSAPHAAGISGWQAITATRRDIDEWRVQPDLGAGLVGRAIKAIDIDIESQAAADEVDDIIQDITGHQLPARMRPHTGRRLLVFRTPAALNKTVIRSPHGAIEFLGDRQFFVTNGLHKSGYRHVWPDGMPTDLDQIPLIPTDTLTALLATLGDEYGATTTSTTTLPNAHRNPSQAATDDPITQFVIASPFFRQHQPDGSIAVICPRHAQHQSTGGARLDPDPSTTVFFPAGLGGRDAPGFKCMHEGHPPISAPMFLDDIGYTLSEFDPVEPAPAPAPASTPTPTIRRKKNGSFDPTVSNLEAALIAPPFHLRTDGFTQTTYITIDNLFSERPLTDTDIPRVATLLERIGCAPTPADNRLRSVISMVAEANRFDSARDWLTGIQWDGIDRLERLPHDVLGAQPSAYTDAVVSYMFSAMAGRVLHPGAKADMVPVLYGKQGVRKSTLLRILAAVPGSYVSVNASDSEDNLSRLTSRGVLIAEMDELKGLSSKQEDAIKSWVTKTEDKWVPKFKEHAVSVPRRFMLAGTTNHRRFLSDSTGNRRWLPLAVCETRTNIDTDYVQNNVEQLWAQGAHMFRTNGVMWQDAERLQDNMRYTRISYTGELVAAYLRKNPGEYTTRQIVDEVFMGEATRERKYAEVPHVMNMLGYAEDRTGVWRIPFA